ncbi:MAG: PQQ-dependent sugar dehydrogenase [Gammaproteobacteria bacterium]
MEVIKKILLVVAFVSCCPLSAADYKAEIIVDGLDYPWSIVFLPSGDAFITEKSGALRIFKQGRLLETPVSGLPRVEDRGQGGLMGIALHPAYAENQRLCLSYTARDKEGASTEVVCGTFAGGKLENTSTIFSARPRSNRYKHFGGRLAFDKEAALYVTLGDRGERSSAQDNLKHNGTLVRVTMTGEPAPGNPYLSDASALPEIFSTGHRNIQGIAIHPVTGDVWTHEHGPQGGDEVNITRRGRNYGWPIITYGVNYGFGTKIGEGTTKPGLEQPVHKWIPSIAPAGMFFYSGKRYKSWQGDLFVGSLKFGELVKLRFDGDRLVDEKRYFDGAYGGIRDVAEGPDGHIYFLTNSGNGKLMRLVQH